MRRVLLFVNHLERGGTETQLVQLANALLDDPAFEIHIACHRFGPLLEQLLVPRERIRAYPLRGFYRPNGLRQIAHLAIDIRRTGFDLVHAQDFYANVMCAAACGPIKGPKLLVSRRYDERPWWAHRWGEWWSYRLADKVLFNSATVAAQVTAKNVLPRSKAVVIPNGVALERFANHGWHRDQNESEREAPRRIGAVGRLHPNKGHESLLRVVAALVPRWPGIELVLVGSGSCGPGLRDLAVQLGIAARVRFVGEVADVAPLLPTFDVAVLPSHRGEGLPNALLEYMAAGCPIVATTSGGVADAARHGREALLVPPGDEQALEAAIEALLNNPTQCSALSQAARERAAQFAMPRLVAAVRTLYLDLINGVRSQAHSGSAETL